MNLERACRFLAFFLTITIWTAAPFGRKLQGYLGPVLEGMQSYLLPCGFILAAGYVTISAIRSGATHLLLCLGAGSVVFVVISRAILLPIELIHVVEYGLLGMLMAVGWPMAPVWRTLVAANLASLGDEGIQGLTPDRVADVRDLWINGWSILLGSIAALPWRRSTSPNTPGAVVNPVAGPFSEAAVSQDNSV